MLTIADRKWFIDPIQSPDLRSDRVLVQVERYNRNVSQVGTVVKVKGFEVDDKRVWWINELGNYVYGAPVGAKNFPQYRRVVGLEQDGSWFVGESYNRSASQDSMVIRNVLRSDFMVLDTPGGQNYTTVNSFDYVKGAPWATMLMPEASDPDDVVAAKLALAEQKWKRRWAEAEIIREALERGWTSDLEELHDDGHMPKPFYGAVVRATALLNMEAAPTLSETEQAKFLDLAAKGITMNTTLPSRAMVPVTVKFALDLEVDDIDNALDPSMNKLRNGLRDHIGQSDALLGDFVAYPILTSVSA